MSKVAQYLNEHLIGDATGTPTIRAHYATDLSILTQTPEIAVLPKVTNDIRKVARFAWQLAEKGHALSITARGNGTDTTGAAISSGIIIDTSKYLNNILFISTKDKNKIVHVQAGTSVHTLNQTLRWQGLEIHGAPGESTVGGVIAGAKRGRGAGKYAALSDNVERLEVVLANGDILETERISKREVGRRKGLQTMEGDIYRQLDALIDDNEELINTISSERDSVGYQIDQVKNKDGSIDLTPLFVGSQGTLGIISEAVVRTGFYSEDEDVLVATVQDASTAQDLADQLLSLDPNALELLEAELFERARKYGKSYVFSKGSGQEFSTVLYVSFDDFNDRTRERKLKKAGKIIAKANVPFYDSREHKLEELQATRDVLRSNSLNLNADESLAPLCDGAYIPRERIDDFSKKVKELEGKHHVSLPLHVDLLDEIIYTRPLLRLSRLTDKQKVFKLLAAYGQLVYATGGTLGGAQAEGQLNAFAAYTNLDTSVAELYANIRRIFDPHGTLNADAKRSTDIKQLIKALRSDYSHLS